MTKRSESFRSRSESFRSLKRKRSLVESMDCESSVDRKNFSQKQKRYNKEVESQSTGLTQEIDILDISSPVKGSPEEFKSSSPLKGVLKTR